VLGFFTGREIFSENILKKNRENFFRENPVNFFQEPRYPAIHLKIISESLT
jgi:hypothetical protein